MIVKNTVVKKLEEYYQTSGNQMILLYGRRGCRKEELFREFTKDKKFFYYCARQASALEQNRMFGHEIEKTFDLKLSRNTYEEYFNRVKTGDPSKLVVIIDQADYMIKKDPQFVESLVKLRIKRLYPGPVMILLCSSSVVWATQDAKKAFGEDAKRIDAFLEIENLNFLEAVRAFPEVSVPETIKMYGVIGGVPAYMERWDGKKSLKENVCSLILDSKGYLFDEAQAIISAELRELSVYNTILATIARGQNKLNDLYHETGFSRAKISVYMKNLSHFGIVEKLVSFETGGWENAKKGVYQIKDTFVNFWFKFVFPHLSDLYLMKPEEFYTTYIEKELDSYLQRYFRAVCTEYLMILNSMGQLPLSIHKVGTWVGKQGTIDIIAQSADRQNLIGFCNWDQPLMTMAMCEDMARAMEQARLTSEHYYLFSATDFEPALKEYVKRDPSFVLIDMNEL